MLLLTIQALPPCCTWLVRNWAENYLNPDLIPCSNGDSNADDDSCDDQDYCM